MAKFEALWSSNSDEYATPQNVFDELNNEFNFNLDVAANENNHKCEAYFDLKSDGLSQDWGGIEFFVTLHIHKLESGLRKHFMKAKKTIRSLSCLYLAGQIQDIFTIIFISGQRLDLLKAG